MNLTLKCKEKFYSLALFRKHQSVIYCISEQPLQGGSLPELHRRREVVHMDISDAMSLMLTFGIFLIAMLTYIDRNNKRK